MDGRTPAYAGRVLYRIRGWKEKWDSGCCKDI